jgi:hypothetical protein
MASYYAGVMGLSMGLRINGGIQESGTVESMKDPVIEAYKAGIDRTLIRKNLKLTVTERFQQAMELQRFAEELRQAGKRAREASRIAKV